MIDFIMAVALWCGVVTSSKSAQAVDECRAALVQQCKKNYASVTTIDCFLKTKLAK